MRTFTILNFLLLSCAFLLGEGNERKIYLDPSQLYFSEKGIFVQLNDDWFSLSALYNDSHGFYITYLPCPDDYWYCFNCCYCVPSRYSRCPKCNK